MKDISGYGTKSIHFNDGYLTVIPDGKLNAIALMGEDAKYGDRLILQTSQIADVSFKKAGRLTNGRIAITTTNGRRHLLHFRRKDHADFELLFGELQGAIQPA